MEFIADMGDDVIREVVAIGSMACFARGTWVVATPEPCGRVAALRDGAAWWHGRRTACTRFAQSSHVHRLARADRACQSVGAIAPLNRIGRRVQSR